MGAFSQGFAQGSGVADEQRQRHQQLADEQRKVTLKTLQEDAETPEDKVAAIQAVYHKDPGVLKQHVENLTRRITGKQQQPVVTPEQAQQARIAPLAARGKTPEQQGEEQFERQTDYANDSRVDAAQQVAQQRQKEIFGLIDTYIKDPEQNKKAKEGYVEKQAGIQATFKNLPGAAGQPYKTPNGMWVRPIESADGSITEQPMPASYTGPQVKPEKVGSFGEFVASAYGPNATAQQVLDARKQWAAAAAGTTEGTHSIQVPQPDGSIKLFTVSTTSRKDFGAPPLPEAPNGPAPRTTTQSFEGKAVPGLVKPGNIDITNRPNIDNGDGTHSSTFSMSFGTDAGEVLVPGVGDGKTYPLRKLSTAEALDQYKKTGANFGTFKTPQEATAYGQKLHEDQAKYGNRPSSPAPRKHATSNGHAPVSEGRVVGGRQTPAQVKANEAVDTAENAFLDVQKASKDPTPVGDQGVILAWLRGRVNRVTATEIAAVNNLGGATMKLEGALVRIESGKMTDQQRQWFLRSAKDNYATAQQVASKYISPAPKGDGKTGGSKSLADRLNEALQ